MKKIDIHFVTNYPLYIAENLLDTSLLGDFCKKLNKRFVIITDSNLANTLGNKLLLNLKAQDISIELLEFPAGEMHKTRETKYFLEDILLSKHYGRDTYLIALGGGVTSDLVGFIAATYCRGISTLYIPTTLLAMVDASIGGKTGVNTSYGKNMIGCFHQPEAVFIDTQLLQTLPLNEWRNGIVEIIKHSLIADRTLFNLLKHHENDYQTNTTFLIEMIYKSCLIKKNIVEQDEKDVGIRQLLNFGHTIGHAIETLENYQISHGEAVAIGMLVESYLSIQHGFLAKEALIEMTALLKKYGLPLKTSAFLYKNKMKALLCLDKKALASIAQFVLLSDIGQPHIDKKNYTMPINDTLLDEALNWAAKQFFKP